MSKDEDEKGQSLGGYIAEEGFFQVLLNGLIRAATWVIAGIVSVFTGGD